MTDDRPGAVVFDFDGTLVQSNSLKREAFFDIFPAADRDLVTRVLEEHREKTRQEIVRRVLELKAGGAGGSGPDPAEIGRYCGDYNRLVEAGAVTCPTVPGAVETLDRLQGLVPLFINSATPAGPLVRIIAARGWAGYFRAVYGAPGVKADHLLTIARDLVLDPAAMVVVGDGESDLKSARKVGCRFIGVDNEFGTLRGQVPVRPDLRGLENELSGQL